MEGGERDRTVVAGKNLQTIWWLKESKTKRDVRERVEREREQEKKVASEGGEEDSGRREGRERSRRKKKIREREVSWVIHLTKCVGDFFFFFSLLKKTSLN